MHDNGQLDRRDFLKTATVGAVGLGLTGATARRLFAEEKKSDLVKRRPLGKTGLEVSIVAVGCGGMTPQHLPLLQKAYESGIDLYDTASGYQNGRSEEGVGEFLKTVKDREKVKVVSKASGFRTPRGSSKEVYEAFRKHVEGSLRRLKSEYIDIYYWPHGCSNPTATEDKRCREALLKMKEKKILRHIGTSTHSNYAKVTEAAIKDDFYEICMPVLNICTQNPDEAGPAAPGRRRRRGRTLEDTRPMLELAKKKDFPIVVMKAAQPGFLGQNTDALLKKEFPEESGLSRHQKLYTYMLRQEGVSSVVIGMGSAKHLMEAIEVGRA